MPNLIDELFRDLNSVAALAILLFCFQGCDYLQHENIFLLNENDSCSLFLKQVPRRGLLE